MPLARQTAQRNPLREFLGLEAGPGETPSGVAFNDYLASIPNTAEQDREAGVLADMDERAETGIRLDLQKAHDTKKARQEYGMQGSYPLREMGEYEAAQKLKPLMALKQMDVDSADKRFGAQQQLTRGENELDRTAALERAKLSQTGQDARSAAGRAHAINLAKQKGQISGPGFWSSLFGVGGEPEVEEEIEIGTRKVLPNGIEVEWDGTGWAGIE